MMGRIGFERFFLGFGMWGWWSGCQFAFAFERDGGKVGL